MTYKQDLHLRQGETFEFTYTHVDSAGNPVDLTGYSARMRVASSYEGIYEAYLTDTSDADGGSIELGGVLGTVKIKFTATQSAAIAGNLSELLLIQPIQKAKRDVWFIYDLELVSGSAAVTRVLEGTFWLQREVTRSP